MQHRSIEQINSVHCMSFWELVVIKFKQNQNIVISALTKSVALFATLSVFASFANAGSREQAKFIHDRIAGVPPTETVLLEMQTQIEAGNISNIGGGTPSAAEIAMSNDGFYNATLKKMAAPWTNRDFDPFVPLNDYIATFIGIVRDTESDPNIDFRSILTDDILYVGNGVTTGYAINSNQHYLELEASGANLQTALTQTTQSAQTGGIPAAATAGLMTTRAASRAFFIDGTNRAMFRFTLMSQLCVDLEELEDATGVPNRIRQDVSRSPGGDSRLFTNGCVGCHIGMDPMAQAFAYYDFEYPVDGNGDPDPDRGSLQYNLAGDTDNDIEVGSRVRKKYHINASNFPYGFVTPDDSWENYWRQGPNRKLGWSNALTGSGTGAKTMGEEMANSEAFAQCQVKKVFKAVCLRDPVDVADQNQILTTTTNFKSGYNLKQVFAETAGYCSAGL